MSTQPGCVAVHEIVEIAGYLLNSRTSFFAHKRRIAQSTRNRCLGNTGKVGNVARCRIFDFHRVDSSKRPPLLLPLYHKPLATESGNTDIQGILAAAQVVAGGVALREREGNMNGIEQCELRQPGAHWRIYARVFYHRAREQ